MKEDKYIKTYTNKLYNLVKEHNNNYKYISNNSVINNLIKDSVIESIDKLDEEFISNLIVNNKKEIKEELKDFFNNPYNVIYLKLNYLYLKTNDKETLEKLEKIIKKYKPSNYVLNNVFNKIFSIISKDIKIEDKEIYNNLNKVVDNTLLKIDKDIEVYESIMNLYNKYLSYKKKTITNYDEECELTLDEFIKDVLNIKIDDYNNLFEEQDLLCRLGNLEFDKTKLIENTIKDKCCNKINIDLITKVFNINNYFNHTDLSILEDELNEDNLNITNKCINKVFVKK